MIPVMSLSPRTLRRHRDAVVAFHNAYQGYLDAEFGRENTSSEEKLLLRNAVIARMPAAQKGIDAVGVGVSFAPPPMFTGRIPVMHGLANTAFLHEQPGWRLERMAGVQPAYVLVLEMLRLATATADAEIEEAKAKRWNPLFWIHRALSAILGIPAYLLSLIFRQPISRFEEGPFGALLRILAIAINALGVYVAGKAAKVW